MHEHLQFNASQHPSHPILKHTTYFNTTKLKHYLKQQPLHNKHSQRTPHNYHNRHKQTCDKYTHILSLDIKPQETITKYCAHLHRTLAALKRYFPISFVAPLPNYAPFVTLTHTTHIISSTSPHTHHVVTPGYVDRPRQCDGTTGQMDGEAGWWTTSGKIGLPTLARINGVGRQEPLAKGYERHWTSLKYLNRLRTGYTCSREHMKNLAQLQWRRYMCMWLGT